MQVVRPAQSAGVSVQQLDMDILRTAQKGDPHARSDRLRFHRKFGALILSIPEPVIGGLSIVVFGLIAATAGRIWVENKVDFSNPRNLITVAVALTAGAGDLTLRFGDFKMGGIGTATFGAIILYQVLGRRSAEQ